MRILRTPDDRFADLPDYPYEPRYGEVAGPDGGTLRMSYTEVGTGPVVLLLHGEPSWSFLYRHVMAVLAEGGLRAIAVDLVGFGRSDKPAEVGDHTYARHVEWVRALVFDVLDLTDVTMVGQDWGGLIGLRLAAEHPSRFARLVAANTGLPTGDFPLPESWWKFRRSIEKAPSLDIGRYIQSGCLSTLSPEVLAAYEAPFPTEEFKVAARAMPTIVPALPEDPAGPANRAAWEVLKGWDKPFLNAFSDSDPITSAMAPVFLALVPGTQGRTHPTIEGAGHFLQEDAGERLGAEIVTFVRETS